MADNLTTTATVSTVPVATVIATDDAGAGGHVQRVKLSLSADGSAAPITADADGLLVNLGANNDVTVTGTVTATLVAGGDVDVLTVPAPLSTTGTGTEATALRVTVATDSTGVLSVDDNGGVLTVDGTVTAAAQPGVDIGDVTINNAAGAAAVNIQDGGNAITVDGTVTVGSITAGDNNIGNVDIVTMPNVVVGSGTLTAVTTITNAVTVAQATAASLNATVVQGAAGTAWEQIGDVAHDAPGAAINPLAVGGYASAAAPTDVSADADVVRAWMLRNGATATALTAAGALIGGDAANGIDVDVTRLPTLTAVTTVSTVTNLSQQGGVAISLNTGVRDTGTQRVTIATNDSVPVTFTGSTDVATQTSLALVKTAVELIDDPVFADDAAFTVGTSKVMAAGLQAVAHSSAPDVADALDAVIAIANRDRVPFVIGGHPNPFTYSMSITTAVTNAIIGATNAAGTKPVVTGITVVLDNASTVFPTFIIGFGTANTPAMATTPGTAQILASHPGIPAGGGMSHGDGSGMLGVGVDGDEIRITTTGTAGGNGLYVTVTGYLVSS